VVIALSFQLFLSNRSILDVISCFSLLYAPFILFAHPLKYLLNDVILFCHTSVEVEPLYSLCYSSVTISSKPSLNNLLSSNLNIGVVRCDGAPMSSNNGVWSYIDLLRVCAITVGYFNSHSVLISTLYQVSLR
jgi:hypothetical protein